MKFEKTVADRLLYQLPTGIIKSTSGYFISLGDIGGV